MQRAIEAVLQEPGPVRLVLDTADLATELSHDPLARALKATTSSLESELRCRPYPDPRTGPGRLCNIAEGTHAVRVASWRVDDDGLHEDLPQRRRGAENR